MKKSHGALGGGEPGADRKAVEQLAGSEEARRLRALLGQRGDVRGAAKTAAAGDASGLTAMLDQLARSREGAELIERLQRRAKEAGL